MMKEAAVARRDLPFQLAAWEITLACGLFKIAIALAAAALPELDDYPLPSSVGWMVLAGGISELVLAWSGRHSWVGRLTFASGALTVILGAIFINGRWTGLFPLAAFVMIWLLLRGIVSVDIGIQSRATPAANWVWLVVRGATDMCLGLMLLLGAPLAMLPLAVLGETREVVGSFCFTLAVSFFVAGAGLVVIALAQRRLRLNDAFFNEAEGSEP